MRKGWYKSKKDKVSHFFIDTDHVAKLRSVCGKRELVCYGFDILSESCPDVGCKECRELMALKNAGGK